jgi:hypothetical protein
MLNFEEELAKFKPIEEMGDAAELISDEPLVDLTDIMKRMLEEAPAKE